MLTSFAMYRYMELERENMLLDQQEARAGWVAKSGVEAAIAQMQTAIASGKTGDILSNPLAIEVPVYIMPRWVDENADPKVSRDPAVDLPVIDTAYAGRAAVVITDESAKINVNLAPPAVLMSILKIDGDKARQIRERLPRLDGAAPAAGDENRTWLATVEELVNNGLVTSEVLTAERAADLTAQSAADLNGATAQININTASSAVIEAALGVTPDVAKNVIAARPISSADALKAAAGKDATGFNFKPPVEDPTALPREIAFSSRCFRIASVGKVEDLEGRAQKENIVARAIEAVVYFPENASPRVIYWNETNAKNTTN